MGQNGYGEEWDRMLECGVEIWFEGRRVEGGVGRWEGCGSWGALEGEGERREVGKGDGFWGRGLGPGAWGWGEEGA